MIQDELIEKIHYPRKLIPEVYLLVNTKFKNDFDVKTHSFLRDYRNV